MFEQFQTTSVSHLGDGEFVRTNEKMFEQKKVFEHATRMFEQNNHKLQQKNNCLWYANPRLQNEGPAGEIKPT